MSHFALPTRKKIFNWFTKGRTNPNCESCRSEGQQRIESHEHLFFECPQATKIWERTDQVIERICGGNQASHFDLAFAVFPSPTFLPTKKLVMTIIQITLYHIWIARNGKTFENFPACTENLATDTIRFYGGTPSTIFLS